MPSDMKKKRALAKKEAAKRKPFGKKPTTAQDNASKEEELISNGNDDPTVDEKKVNGCSAVSQGEMIGSMDDTANDLVEELAKFEILAAERRACTGVLASHSEVRDLHIHQVSITFFGHELLVDSKLELNVGRRYGLIGVNGCGKSTLLTALANSEFPVPEHFDMYHLRREMPPSEKTALQAVLEVDKERLRLELEAEELAVNPDDESQERLMDVYERLENMEADKAEARAGIILHGLGFTSAMQKKSVRSFSGGWRMRIALARALLIQPSILLLDEPTNHLDLEACVWLEYELRKYTRILVIVSHSQDFLNGVCTNIINMTERKLVYYTGNYDQYMQTRLEQMENQAKMYKWEQNQISHMKNYIARFGHGSAKLARQAQSKQKTLNKMVDKGLTNKVSSDKSLTFYFIDCDPLPPPVIMIQHASFRYNDDSPYLYRDLDFGVDLDTRVALVGPNGAGKSTLLKLICGELHPTEGMIRRHPHLKIGRYHQHLHEILDLSSTALDWMLLQFPDIKERDQMRKILGRYGISGQQQICPIRNLSDGQRCRIIFGWLAYKGPHILLLDEPTNHLDMETIDSLAEAINAFSGGMIVVSHDFRLIDQVAEKIWVCDKGAITEWETDIFQYKKKLAKNVLRNVELASAVTIH